jgi:hypothetical protein
MIPLIFVLGLFAGLPLSLAYPRLGAAYAAALCAYGAVLVAGALGIGIRWRNLWTLPSLVAVFATIHLGSGIGMLLEVIRPRQPIAFRKGEES